MGAAEKQCDFKTLLTFSPLNQLDAEKCNELAQKSTLRSYQAGEQVYKLHGEAKYLFFLLSGSLEIIHNNKKTKIKSGSKQASTPLEVIHGKHYKVVTKTPTDILIVNNELLDLLLNWDKSSGYEVGEVNSENENEWIQTILQNKSLLKLSPTNIQAIMACIETLPVKSGQTIIKQGEQDNYYYIISKGKCRVTKTQDNSAKPTILAELSEGEAFGEEALIADSARNATITMLEDGLLLRLDRQDFAQFITQKMIRYIDADKAKSLLDDNGQWIDVRSPEDYVNNGIGFNIPLPSVRILANELNKQRPYILYCEDGKKSAIAAFLLSQRNLDVYVLEGGLEKNNIQHLTSALTDESKSDNLYFLNQKQSTENNEQHKKLLQDKENKIRLLESKLQALLKDSDDERDNSTESLKRLQLSHSQTIEKLHKQYQTKIKAHTKLYHEVESQHAQQQLRIDELESATNKYQQEVAQAKKQASLAHDKDEFIASMQKDFDEQTQQYKIEIEELRSLTKKQQADFLDLTNLHSQLQSEAQNQQSSYQEKFLELTSNIDEQRKKNNELINEQVALNDKLKQQDILIEEQTSKIEELRQHSQEQVTQITELTSVIGLNKEELNQKQNQVSQLENALTSLEEKHQQEVDAHRETHEQLTQLEKEDNSKASHIENIETEKTDALNSINKLEDKILDLNSHIETLSNEKTEITRQAEEQLSHHTKQTDELKNALASMDEQHQQEISAHRESQQRLTQFEKEDNNKTSRIETLETEKSDALNNINKLEDNVLDLNNHIETLNNEKTEFTRQAEELKNTLASVEEKYQQEITTHNETRTKLSTLETDFSNKDTRYQAIEAEKNNALNTVSELEDKILDLNNQIEELSDTSHLESTLSSLEEKYQQEVTSHKETQTKLSNLESDILNKDYHANSIIAEKAKALDTIAELENEVSTLSNHLKEASNEKQALKDQKENAISELNAKIAQLKSEHEQDKTQLINNYDQKLSDQQDTSATIQMLEKHNNQLQSQIEQLTHENTTTLTNIDNLQHQITELTTTLKSEKNTSASTTKVYADKVRALETHSKELNQQLKATQSNEEAQEQLLIKMQQQLHGLQQRAEVAEQTAEVLEFQLARQQEGLSE